MHLMKSFIEKNWFKLSLSILFLVIVVTRILFPLINIDSISVALLTLALVPWLGSLFDSIEFPGGLKFGYKKELEEVKKGIAESQVVSEEEPIKKPFIKYFPDSNDEPMMKIAWYRKELEYRLKKLTTATNVPHTSSTKLASDLVVKKVIPINQFGLIEDVLAVMNNVVHGNEVDVDTYDWVINTMPSVLKGLDNLIKK